MIDFIPSYVPQPVKEHCELILMGSSLHLGRCNVRYISTWGNNELYVIYFSPPKGKYKYTNYYPVLYDCTKAKFYNGQDRDKIKKLIEKNIRKNNEPAYCNSLI